MRIKEFLELLNLDSRGRSWQLTLSYCLSENRCTVQDSKEILMRSIHNLEEAVSAGHALSPGLIWNCLFLEMQKTEIDLTRKEIRKSSVKYEFSHITTLDAARTFHFPKLNDVLVGTTAMSPQTDKMTRLNLIKEFLAKVQKSGDLKPAKGSMTGLKRLWIGLEITDMTKPLDAAMIARDERGLVHLEMADFLLQYIVDSNEVDLVVRPTSLDGVGKRFRSWGDKTIHEPFGTTVHLAKLAQNESNIDGVAECIAPAMNLTDSLVRKISAVGHPLKTRGLEFSDNDSAYAIRLQENLAVRSHDVNKFLQTLY